MMTIFSIKYNPESSVTIPKGQKGWSWANMITWAKNVGLLESQLLQVSLAEILQMCSWQGESGKHIPFP